MPERVLPRAFPLVPELLIPLSNVELQELGTFAAIWGQIDWIVLTMIAHLIKADFGAVQFMLDAMTTGPRIAMLSRLCQQETNDTNKAIKKLCDDNGGLIEDRNHIIHGLWGIEWNPGGLSKERMGKRSVIWLQPKGLAMAKNTICLWYDKDAEAAARFYAETFPGSAVGAVHRAPSDYPSGKAGDVLVVEFTVAGIPCISLNGGPAFKHNEAFLFQIATDDQQETDRYWNAIVGNGGQESECGWCKDKWGVSWQITPRVLTEALAVGGDEAKRAFDAMMGMKKIDVGAIKAARRGFITPNT
jgi:predicted 3-demethylubiquinone-9 3-methyltransferase (glyoxalase superfamily)